jgi:hypothetical protein
MSTNPQLNASNYIVNIIELQNVITNASGLTPLDVLSNQVQNIATMVNFDLKRININTIAKYDTTPIQVLDDINLSNATIYQNGTAFVGGGSINVTGGGTQISSGTTSIVLLSNTSNNQPLISFNIANQTIMGFTSNSNAFFSGNQFTISSPASLAITGNNAAPGKTLVCLNSTGSATWGYPSTLATADFISLRNETGAEFARFTNTGRLGLGTTAPLQLLDVNGSANIRSACDITGNCSAFSFLSLSDKRFKTDIRPLEHATQMLENMRGVRFMWRDLSQNDVGVIAQEIQEVLPEAVVGQEKLSVAYHKLIPVLLESMKELHERVKLLEKALRTR